MGVRSVLLSQHYQPPLPPHTRYAAEWLYILPERLGIVRVTHACLTKTSLKCIELLHSYYFRCILHLTFVLFVHHFLHLAHSEQQTVYFCTKQHHLCMHVVV